MSRLGARGAAVLALAALALSSVGVGHGASAQAPAAAEFVSDLPEDWPESPPATARAYILTDAVTGQVLAARDADDPLPVASTVKLLTLLTALETLDFHQSVTVGEEVTVGGAGVGLSPGDTWTVEQLVDAVIVRSGNDAARALAVAAGGSIEGFVGQMRQTAERFGLDGAIIEDPTGLDDTNRLTARHLAVLAQATLADPRLAQAAAKTSVDLPSVGVAPTRNLLLEQYPGATGIKTGYTDLSGWSLVASAERDGRELVAVVLGAREDADRFNEAARLLDHGFTRFAASTFEPWRLRVPGGWVDYEPALPRVWIPADDTVTVAAAVPSPASEPITATVSAGNSVLLEMAAEAVAEPSAVQSAETGVGVPLVERLYAAMRTAHRLDLWGAGPGGRRP